eukprot:8235242-Pyramimonas_sp.AAC.1
MCAALRREPRFENHPPSIREAHASYLAARTDRFLVGSKESILTPQGGLGGIRTDPDRSGSRSRG